MQGIKSALDGCVGGAIDSEDIPKYHTFSGVEGEESGLTTGAAADDPRMSHLSPFSRIFFLGLHPGERRKDWEATDWKNSTHLYMGPKGVHFVPIFAKIRVFFCAVDENAKNLIGE